MFNLIVLCLPLAKIVFNIYYFCQDSEYDLQENEIFTTAKTVLQDMQILA